MLCRTKKPSTNFIVYIKYLRLLRKIITIKITKYKSGVLGRFHPTIGHKGPWGEQKYSSTLFLTSALEGGEGSASRLGRTLPPGKTRYRLYRRLGGPQGRSGRVRKISPPPGFDPRTVQPVGSRYTNYPTRPTSGVLYLGNIGSVLAFRQGLSNYNKLI
jgi:hypothetical protein